MPAMASRYAIAKGVTLLASDNRCPAIKQRQAAQAHPRRTGCLAFDLRVNTLGFEQQLRPALR